MGHCGHYNSNKITGDFCYSEVHDGITYTITKQGNCFDVFEGDRFIIRGNSLHSAKRQLKYLFYKGKEEWFL